MNAITATPNQPPIYLILTYLLAVRSADRHCDGSSGRCVQAERRPVSVVVAESRWSEWSDRSSEWNLRQVCRALGTAAGSTTVVCWSIFAPPVFRHVIFFGIFRRCPGLCIVYCCSICTVLSGFPHRLWINGWAQNGRDILTGLLLVYFGAWISGNLEMSGNLAKVRGKSQSQEKVREFM